MDNKALMNVIQNYRVVYDKTCTDYTDIWKKENAWKGIAQELGMDVAEAQRTTALEPTLKSI